MEIKSIQPGYIDLYKSGELKKRVDILESRLSSCDICPRKCGANRLENITGFCHSGYLPLVASVCDHHGEEPALSGTKGSGTIFFANCNMRCVYCQNYQISQNWGAQKRNEKDFQELAQNMLFLQDKLGCHNINLVSPSHFVPQIMKSLMLAIPMGLKIPIVYNTNAYDSLETLRLLEGIIDIYLPDLRYASNKAAVKYSMAPDYVQYSRQAISEMYRQVGNLNLDDNEIAFKGLIVRHLILPNGLAGSQESLTWLTKEISNEVTISIMSQYYPAHKAIQIPILARSISVDEFDNVNTIIADIELENGWVQQFGSDDNYLPDFDKEGHPFISS